MSLKSISFLSIAAIAVCLLSYFFLDVPIALFFASSDGPVKYFFATITYLGESTVYLLVSATLALWYRLAVKKPVFSNMALFVFASIAVSGTFNALIKYIVGRGRPGILEDHGIYGFDFFSSSYDYSSFPSGHANTIAALLTALYLILPRRNYIYVIAAILPIMSRVVIGAHFLSDIIFGSYLGVVTTILLRRIFKKKGMWRSEKQDPSPDSPGVNREPISKAPTA